MNEVMNGTEVYTSKVNNRISAFLELNNSRKYLIGYSNHLRITKSENTVYSYIRQIADFMNYCKDKPVSELSYDDYVQYENQFTEMTSSYRIMKHSALKTFSEYCYLSGLNEIDPMVRSKSPKSRQSIETIEKRERNYLDKKEVKVLIDHVESGVGSQRAKARQAKWIERDKAIIITFLNTGMRCSALYKLDVSDIDRESRVLRIKEKGRVRSYILNDTVIEALDEWLPVREERLEGREENALFISNRLTRMSMCSISELIQKYGEGVKDIHLTPHKLRATAGTFVQSRYGDLNLTKEFLGHSNVNTTMLYIRGQEMASKKKAAEALSELFE